MSKKFSSYYRISSENQIQKLYVYDQDRLARNLQFIPPIGYRFLPNHPQRRLTLSKFAFLVKKLFILYANVGKKIGELLPKG